MPKPDPDASPPHPIPAVGVVCLRSPDEVLLIRRGKPPGAGGWSLPGGRLEWGERLHDAALRELFEETGVRAEMLGLIDVVDGRFEPDPDGRPTHHYVLVDHAVAVPPTRAEWVDSMLRRAIVHGELAPGEKLYAERLAEQWGVSATPLRETFQRLAGEGLVIIEPQRGARVAPVGVEQGVEIYEIDAKSGERIYQGRLGGGSIAAAPNEEAPRRPPAGGRGGPGGGGRGGGAGDGGADAGGRGGAHVRGRADRLLRRAAV